MSSIPENEISETWKRVISYGYELQALCTVMKL